jgi:hypothetical protein
MKRLVAALFVLLLVGQFAGCYKHVYVSGDPAMSSPNYERWHHHLIAGLINLSDETYLSQICPSGVARIEDKHTFLNMLVAGLTMSIYSPTTVKIWCKGASAAVTVPVELNDEISAGLLLEYPNIVEHVQALQAREVVPAQ